MFAPVGYSNVQSILDDLGDIVALHFFPPDTLPFIRVDRVEDIDLMKDWIFRAGAVRNWVLYRVLGDTRVPVFACSASGVILKLGYAVCEYVEFGDAATEDDLLSFDPIESPVEVQMRVYRITSMNYRFIDLESGLIDCSELHDPTTEQYGVSNWGVFERVLEQFSDWSLCVRDDDLPKSASEYLSFIDHNGKAEKTASGEGRPRRGRPSQREAAASLYYIAFPHGHEQAGKSWKEALRTVNQNLPRKIQIDTLKRALGLTQHKPQ